VNGPRQLCSGSSRDFFSDEVVDQHRQVPAPSAVAWVVDLRDVRGAILVVLRRSETEARHALVAHLVDIGAVASIEEAVALAADSPAEHVGVIW
jgi:hypothetical protein